jgi:2-dehydro-3-deoxyphosphogluconate aldolase / (4S)-4-hydroxy-2-oxoglutarate aldolase
MVALNDVFARLGVIPVLSVEEVERAEPLADALAAGGLPVAEITFRTAAAAAVIERLARRRPDVLVGAGTVLSVESLLAARDAGARFALAPGFTPEVVAKAQEIGMPFFPGVMTPSEIQGALACGARVVKFFPAQAAGGPAMLRALAAPYAFYGVRFIPTGGVNSENLEAWLALESVVAVGGTWIATPQQIAGGDWVGIRGRAAAARAAVARCRPSPPVAP